MPTGYGQIFNTQKESALTVQALPWDDRWTRPIPTGRTFTKAKLLPPAADVASFIVMDACARGCRDHEARGRIIMEVGQPGTPAPGVLDAVRAALDTETLGYTAALGIDALEGAARLQVTETATARRREPHHRLQRARRPLFTLAFLAIFDTGARVALLPVVPGYPRYRQSTSAARLHPPLDRDRPRDAMDAGFVDAVSTLHRDVGLGASIASPANPTGTMIEPAAPRRAGLLRATTTAHLANLGRDLRPRPDQAPATALVGLQRCPSSSTARSTTP